MSKLSYRLGLALLVLPACGDDGSPSTDSDTSSSTTDTSTSDPSTAGPTTVTPTTVDPPTTTDVTPTTTDTTDTTTTDTTTTTTTDTTTDSTSTTDTTTTDSTSTTDTTTETSSTTDAPDECADGTQNGAETDIDCGGPVCAPCNDGQACLEDSDCASASCVDNLCVTPPPACMDGQQNNAETDVDCGGPECPDCADGLTCLVDDDCVSGVCTNEVCQAAACDDQVKNGDETDVDCGGPLCGGCLDGDSCLVNGDCASGVCDNNICAPAACFDQQQNGNETDVDCGGDECQPCADGLACLVDADCAGSSACVENVCTSLSSSCDDGVQNGSETGVDCGGPDCKPCSVPGLVINEVDYDQVDADTEEFIELLNTSDQPIDLAGYAIVLVNGSNNTVYTTRDLSPAGTINPGQYLVIAKAGFAVPDGVLKINFAGNQDQIQNGAPDGIALVGNGALIDALSYEGSITVNIPNVGAVSLVEGTPLPVEVQDSNTEVRSLCRIPNGYDGNNAATDWTICATLTPGAANVP
jgi:hypothetical protein